METAVACPAVHVPFPDAWRGSLLGHAPYVSDHVSEQVAVRQSIVSKLSPAAADYHSHGALQCESSHSPLVWVRPRKCTNAGTWRATASPLMSNTRAHMQRGAKQKQPRTRPAAVAESMATAMQNACSVSHRLSMRPVLNNASAARPGSQDACRSRALMVHPGHSEAHSDTVASH